MRWCPGHYDAAIAPDLIITVRSPALDRALVRRLRATAKESGTAAIAGSRSVGGVVIVDGHSALADHADWNASVWSFSLEGREKLVGAVDLILAALPGRFTLEATWAGDATLRADSISREELRHRIVENQVENRVRYLVLPTEPWFPLWIGPPERMLSYDENAFLREARTAMLRLAPARAANTWAVLYVSELTLVVPLDGELSSTEDGRTLHTSLQLHMCERKSGPMILGDWQDAHYAWDVEPQSALFEVSGHDGEARRAALAWLETQMRRPIVRRDWHVLNRAIASAWLDAGGGAGRVLEVHGLGPVALMFRNRWSAEVRAGFFDTWMSA